MEENKKQWRKKMALLWQNTPLSLLLTLVVAFYATYLLYGLLLQKPVDWLVGLIPFKTNEMVLIIHWTIKMFLFLIWFVFSLEKVEERHMMVLKVFGQRIHAPSFYFYEGWKGTIFPTPIISGDHREIREITISNKVPKEDREGRKNA